MLETNCAPSFSRGAPILMRTSNSEDVMCKDVSPCLRHTCTSAPASTSTHVTRHPPTNSSSLSTFNNLATLAPVNDSASTPHHYLTLSVQLAAARKVINGGGSGPRPGRGGIIWGVSISLNRDVWAFTDVSLRCGGCDGQAWSSANVQPCGEQ